MWDQQLTDIPGLGKPISKKNKGKEHKSAKEHGKHKNRSARAHSVNKCKKRDTTSSIIEKHQRSKKQKLRKKGKKKGDSKGLIEGKNSKLPEVVNPTPVDGHVVTERDKINRTGPAALRLNTDIDIGEMMTVMLKKSTDTTSTYSQKSEELAAELKFLKELIFIHNNTKRRIKFYRYFRYCVNIAGHVIPANESVNTFNKKLRNIAMGYNEGIVNDIPNRMLNILIETRGYIKQNKNLCHKIRLGINDLQVYLRLGHHLRLVLLLLSSWVRIYTGIEELYKNMEVLENQILQLFR